MLVMTSGYFILWENCISAPKTSKVKQFSSAKRRRGWLKDLKLHQYLWKKKRGSKLLQYY